MKLGLIFSNDWELFGDGSGDYFDIQHRPLERMLDIADTHGARVTVMAEVGQQWAHEANRSRDPVAARVSEAWAEILRDTIRRGSDVQLHLHTQWLDAVRRADTWQLHFDRWAISSLPPALIAEVLLKGKTMLESLLCPVDPTYACVAFRAGAYCIEPSEAVIGAFEKTGILCDTSVTKGLFDATFYDFRDAAGNVVPWYVSDSDVKYRGDRPGILEIPIASLPGWDSAVLRRYAPGVFYRLKFGTTVPGAERAWLRTRDAVAGQRYPVSRRPFMAKKKRSLRWILSKFFAHGAFQLDYDHLPAHVFVRCLERIWEHPSVRDLRERDLVLPVMSSGHVKNMHNCDNFARILELASDRFGDRLVFIRLRDAVHSWISPASGER